MRVLVACFGNVLRGDDGCGVEIARRLLVAPVPGEVRVLDVGIGGIHLVQELLDPSQSVDALVVVDAVDLGRAAGTVVVMEPDVQDVGAMSPAARRDQLADVHYATPARALMLAAALGALPARTLLVGVQVADPERVGEGLAPELEQAVALAADEVRRVVTELGVRWPGSVARTCDGSGPEGSRPTTPPAVGG